MWAPRFCDDWAAAGYLWIIADQEVTSRIHGADLTLILQEPVGDVPPPGLGGPPFDGRNRRRSCHACECCANLVRYRRSLASAQWPAFTLYNTLSPSHSSKGLPNIG